ncbi:MAG: hypothetical protein ABII06_11765 [Pseudomonadota bacterium]
MMMFQITAFGIVVIYLLQWFVREDDPGSFFLKFTAISAAGWMVEETAIRIYHFYQYSPDWDLFLGHVPILVVLVWPLVIHSGWELASRLMSGNKRHVHLAAAVIIGIDASLVETISVKAGLWSWNTGGIWGVPLIGIFGWVYFSLLSILILRLKRVRKAGIAKLFFMFILTVCSTHVLIVATWWLIFRWIPFPINPALTAAMAWFVSILLMYSVHRSNLGGNLDSKILILRVPPALLFFILYLKGSPEAFYTAYAVAFAFSYLFLLCKISTGRQDFRLSKDRGETAVNAPTPSN